MVCERNVLNKKQLKKDQRSSLHSMDHIPEIQQLLLGSLQKRDHIFKSSDIGKDLYRKIIFGKFQEMKFYFK